MSNRLIRTAADWIPIWRARKAELDLTDQAVDALAGWDRYCSKILCGKKKPTTKTIARMNGALALELTARADPEREAIVKEEAVKRRRS
jgi:hypothetical protein